VSVTVPGRSFLAAGDLQAVAQAVIDGLQTAIELAPCALTLYRRDPVTAALVAQPVRTVALAWARRQAADRGSETAAATLVAGSFRGYAPWDVAVGDRFVLPEGAGQIVPPVTTVGGVTRADFALDQGSP
jgi:hypothetical protein